LARSLVSEHFATVEALAIPSDVGFTPPASTDDGDSTSSSSLCFGGNLSGNGVTGYPVVPGSYTITDTFGPRAEPITGLGTFHRGIDLAVPGCEASPPNKAIIYAVQNGVVTKAMEWDSYGYMVEITHTDVFTTRYAHMMANTFAVKVGDEVVVGQPIGIMGTTGASTGCHLHFETFVDGVRVNPNIVMLRLGIKL
jgi:YD repeat-containing protein